MAETIDLETESKKPRQTTFMVKCAGVVIAHTDSYYSRELEYGQLLHSASKAAADCGYDCINKLEEQRGVPCEMLTVEAVQ